MKALTRLDFGGLNACHDLLAKTGWTQRRSSRRGTLDRLGRLEVLLRHADDDLVVPVPGPGGFVAVDQDVASVVLEDGVACVQAAAYAARYVAKNIVAAGLAKQCQIQVPSCGACPTM